MFKYTVDVNTKVGQTFVPAGGKKMIVKSLSKEFVCKFVDHKNHNAKIGQTAVFASCVLA